MTSSSVKAKRRASDSRTLAIKIQILPLAPAKELPLISRDPNRCLPGQTAELWRPERAKFPLAAVDVVV